MTHLGIPVARLARALAALACLGLSACSPSGLAPGASSGSPVAAAADAPVVVLITLPAGAIAPADYAARLESLRGAGAQVRWFESLPGPKPVGFASLAVVTFPGEARFDAWSTAEGSAIGEPLRVRRADVLAHDGIEGGASAHSFFAVNRYESKVTPEEYRVYTREYVVPNMAHQKAVGALIAYTMYIEREPQGAQPTAVLVKEYRSPEEQARGEVEKERYKTEVLLKQPRWRQIHDTKGAIRTDLSETFATEVAPGR